MGHSISKIVRIHMIKAIVNIVKEKEIDRENIRIMKNLIGIMNGAS
jgi:hypothetical protein